MAGGNDERIKHFAGDPVASAHLALAAAAVLTEAIR